MNRTLKNIVVLTVLVFTLFGLAGFAAADDETTPAPQLLGLKLGRQARAFDKVVEMTGLSPEDVWAMRREGKSLADIAKTKDITVEELVKAIVDERKAQLEQYLKEGKITSTQYDMCVNLIEERVKAAVNGDAFGPANGFGYGSQNRPGGRGMGRGAGNGFRLNR